MIRGGDGGGRHAKTHGCPLVLDLIKPSTWCPVEDVVSETWRYCPYLRHFGGSFEGVRLSSFNAKEWRKFARSGGWSLGGQTSRPPTRRRLIQLNENDEIKGALRGESIAYFSMEIGLDEKIPTYAGGLGTLAGDTVKSSADLGIPIVAVTLASRKGSFRPASKKRKQTANPPRRRRKARTTKSRPGRRRKKTADIPKGWR